VSAEIAERLVAKEDEEDGKARVAGATIEREFLLEEEDLKEEDDEEL